MRRDALHSRALTKPGPTQGFTLVEILLALAVLALVSSLVAGMIHSTSRGVRDQQDLRRRSVRAEVVAARLDGAIRSSTMVLAAGSNWLVLWKGDSRTDGRPNVSEIQRIEWDAATRRVRSYAAPSNLAEADDTSYPLSADFGAVSSALKGTASFPAETWCERATAWQVIPSGAGQATRLVGYTLTLEDPAGTSSFSSAVALRGS